MRHLGTEERPEPLTRWDRLALAAFLALVVAFGVLVEIRSAFLSQRRTDLDVYLRAAWAVRTGQDIYAITDDHGWHYCYPPLTAILLAPLADPPAGADRTAYSPFAISVAFWYLFSVLCVFLAAHWFTATLEEASDSFGEGRRWWYRRNIPICLLLGPIGCALSRGQVNLLLILLIAGWFRAMAQQKQFRSGLWLAGAICLKFIPGFLVLVPLWRKEWRSLGGVAVGVALGFGVIPAAVWGIPGTVEVNRHFVDAIIHPAVTQGGDETRAKELMEMTATDNQSFQAIIHNYRHWSESPRPPHADTLTRVLHVALFGSLTILTLRAFGPWRDDNPRRLLLLVGCLVLLMALGSPISHTHYFCLALPLAAGLYITSVEERPRAILPRWETAAVLLSAALLFSLTHIPFWEGRREAGLPMYGSLILWLAAVHRLSARPAVQAMDTFDGGRLARAA
jgi:alpha-1,2-mannosyltransferase